MIIQDILPYLQAGVSTATLIGIGYGFWRFTRKPAEGMTERIIKLETRVSELEKSVDANWEQTRKHNTMLDDIQLCILYLLDFEVVYCTHASSANGEEIDTTNLDEARKIIRQRLKQ